MNSLLDRLQVHQAVLISDVSTATTALAALLMSDATTAATTLAAALLSILITTLLWWRSRTPGRCSSNDPAFLALRLNAAASRMHSCARPNAAADLATILGLKASWLQTCLTDLGVNSPSLLFLHLSSCGSTLRMRIAEELLKQRKEKTRVAADAKAESICANLNSALEDHFTARKRQIQVRDQLRMNHAIQQRQQENNKYRNESSSDDHHQPLRENKLANLIANATNTSVHTKQRSINKCNDPEQIKAFYEHEPNAFCGMLLKRKSRRLPLWHSRFFRLGTYYLQYFQDEENAKHNKLLAVIDLRRVVAVRFANKDGGGGATEFVLELPRGRLFAMRAPSPIIAGRWVSELDMTVSRLKSAAAAHAADPSSTSTSTTQRRFWPSLRPWSNSRSVAAAPQTNPVLLTHTQRAAVHDLKEWAETCVQESGLIVPGTTCNTLVELSDTWLAQHLRATNFGLAAAKQLWKDNWYWRRDTRSAGGVNNSDVIKTKRNSTSNMIQNALTASAQSPLQLTSVSGAMERKGLSTSLQSAWQDRFVGVDTTGNPIEYFAPALINPKLVSAERLSQPSYVANVLKVLVDKCELANSMLRGMSMVEGRVVTSSCLIVDMNGFSADDHMVGVAMVLTALAALRNRYPARFASVLIVRAPWQFASMYDMLFPQDSEVLVSDGGGSGSIDQGNGSLGDSRNRSIGDGCEVGNVYWLSDEHDSLMNQLEDFMPLMCVPAQLRGPVTTIAA